MSHVQLPRPVPHAQSWIICSTKVNSVLGSIGVHTSASGVGEVQLCSLCSQLLFPGRTYLLDTYVAGL